ncbi:DUF433 domain-containing protein [Cyanobacteria bacterium FACHB-63]|nr:DUF433 domain-containing protein [Cyanobacteria bacterium FACHB-63]
MGRKSTEIAPHISVDSKIHHGVSVITGTRVPVSIVIGSLAGGMSKEEVMQEYELTKTQVEAALGYAADLVKQTEVTVLEFKPYDTRSF